jgi:hypothetical protein
MGVGLSKSKARDICRDGSRQSRPMSSIPRLPPAARPTSATTVRDQDLARRQRRRSAAGEIIFSPVTVYSRFLWPPLLAIT